MGSSDFMIGRSFEGCPLTENEYFLGMWVQQDLTLGMIQLSQQPYWELVINHFQLKYIMPRNTPLSPRIILNSNMSPKMDSEKKAMDDKPYRSVLGSVMWELLGGAIYGRATDSKKRRELL